jgi:predicted nucleotidyltransferase
MPLQIAIPEEEIADFCRRWDLAELAVFGSVLRPDFNSSSDIDVMVRYSPSSPRSLFEMVRMQGELEQILGRKVDLLSRTGVERSRNEIRKRAILDSAYILYAA